MHLNSSPTELTTAATDAVVGVVCLWVLLWLLSTPVAVSWKKRVWAFVFALLMIASTLGTFVHGLQLSEPVRAILWQPLFLALGLAVSFFLVGALGDWRGEAAARRAFPWAIGLGAILCALTWVSGGGFVIFIGYEVAAMVAALALFLYLGRNRQLPGASLVALGIGLTLVAAGIQVSRLTLRVILPFDHNGLFHVVQLIALAVMASGLRLNLARKQDRP